nr:hypothetical protein [Tanacetum cinerariifolium]
MKPDDYEKVLIMIGSYKYNILVFSSRLNDDGGDGDGGSGGDGGGDSGGSDGDGGDGDRDGVDGELKK